MGWVVSVPETRHFKGARTGQPVEVHLHADGTLDEVVTGGVHLEQMDEDKFWCSFDGIHVWFTAVDGKLQVEWLNGEECEEVGG